MTDEKNCLEHLKEINPELYAEVMEVIDRTKAIGGTIDALNHVAGKYRFSDKDRAFLLRIMREKTR